MSVFNGKKIRLSIFGRSHSEAIGCVLDGIPSGFEIDIEKLQSFVNRRSATNAPFSTSRIEPDKIHILSGIGQFGKTCGSALCAIIENSNFRSQDYEDIKRIPRPSHADYSAFAKFGENYDRSGGGQFSGRMTAPMCIAGGIAKQYLEKIGIRVHAYVSSIGEIKCGSYCDNDFNIDNISKISNENGLFSLKKEKNTQIFSLFEELKKEGDSIGGNIECVILGAKAGIFDTMFDSLESRLSSALFAIPAVKAVRFGIGENFSKMKGSTANDQLRYENGKIITTTNNNGGINGGITNGMPILFGVTVKPTPTISKTMNSVDLQSMQNVELNVKGRHDVCIVPRAVAVVEAVSSLVMLDGALE